MSTKLVKLVIMLAFPIVFWLLPAPTGLTPVAWHLLGWYLAAIIGLMIKPVSEPLVLLITIAGSSLFLGQAKEVLSGYAATVSWLVFCAFSLSVAFVKTGLGKRLAYTLIGSFGKTTLRLGYVNALLDLIIAPVTPSNTARAGGIILPIMNSISYSFGSTPGPTAKKVGKYLIGNMYHVDLVTSFMFMTAQAPNVLIAVYGKQILGIDVSWGTWAVAMVVPGLLLLAVTPLLSYFLIRPEIKDIDNKKIAREGLEELGPMKKSEKSLVLIFVLALLGWALPSLLQQVAGIKLPLDSTAVAIAAMVACFLLNVLTWDDMLENKGAWNTLLWFGGIVGMATALDKAKFFTWLAKVLGDSLHFGDNSFMTLIMLGILSILIRYVFASASSYVVAMLPVFLTLGKLGHVEPMALILLLMATNGYGGNVTHYACGPSPVVYGAGFVDAKSWWINGAVMALIGFIVTMVVGYPWWKMIGLF